MISRRAIANLQPKFQVAVEKVIKRRVLQAPGFYTVGWRTERRNRFSFIMKLLCADGRRGVYPKIQIGESPMKIKISKANLLIGIGSKDAPIPHTCEYMQAQNPGEFLVPVHRDECGDSSSLRIFSWDWMAERSPLGTQVHWAEEYPGEYQGMHKVRIQRGDRLEITTFCCKITAKVVAVDTSACSVQLCNVEFDGPWANFCEGSSTLTFGSVVYKTSGMEEVDATRFLGTLEQYRQLREVEPKGLPWEETAGRRDSACLIPSPDHEHSEQLAEAAGY